jgi:acylphosphatase
MIRRRLLVSGRVQGVFYRDTCKDTAESAGVAGSARNLPDGRVEVVLEGHTDAVNEVIEWCRRGTAQSKVESVEVADEPPDGARGFRIL